MVHSLYLKNQNLPGTIAHVNDTASMDVEADFICPIKATSGIL